MNRTAISILILLFTGSLATNGQFIGSLGAKAGLTLANQSHQFTPIDYTMETESIIGPVAGIFMEVFRKKHLSFQLDLAYVAKGSKTTTESITVNHLENDRISVNQGDLTVSNFNYLVASPMVRFRFDKRQISPYLMLGPRFDYLLNYKTDSDHPLEEQNSFLLGIHGGAGVEYILRNLGIFIEVQYQSDLQPVTTQDPILINNNVLLFNLGIRYHNVSR